MKNVKLSKISNSTIKYKRTLYWTQSLKELLGCLFSFIWLKTVATIFREIKPVPIRGGVIFKVFLSTHPPTSENNKCLTHKVYQKYKPYSDQEYIEIVQFLDFINITCWFLILQISHNFTSKKIRHNFTAKSN